MPPPDEPPARVYTAAELAEIDRLATAEFSVPSILLMEAAARAAAGVLYDMLSVAGFGPVLFVCGPGHNGGDGLAAARLMHAAGGSPLVALVGDPDSLRGDSLMNLRMARARGISVERVGSGRALADLARALDPAAIVDALLGTGLDRPVGGAMLEAIRAINALDIPVLSIDVPSGLAADTGEPWPESVSADVTVTFTGYKAGFESLVAQRHLGELFVDDLGLPRALLERFGVEAPPEASWRAEPHPDDQDDHEDPRRLGDGSRLWG